MGKKKNTGLLCTGKIHQYEYFTDLSCELERISEITRTLVKQILFRLTHCCSNGERENHLVEVILQSCCTKCGQEEESFGSSLIIKYVTLPSLALLLCFSTSGAFLTRAGTW